MTRSQLVFLIFSPLILAATMAQAAGEFLLDLPAAYRSIGR